MELTITITTTKPSADRILKGSKRKITHAHFREQNKEIARLIESVLIDSIWLVRSICCWFCCCFFYHLLYLFTYKFAKCGASKQQIYFIASQSMGDCSWWIRFLWNTFKSEFFRVCVCLLFLRRSCFSAALNWTTTTQLTNTTHTITANKVYGCDFFSYSRNVLLSHVHFSSYYNYTLRTLKMHVVVHLVKTLPSIVRTRTIITSTLNNDFLCSHLFSWTAFHLSLSLSSIEWVLLSWTTFFQCAKFLLLSIRIVKFRVKFILVWI